MVHGWLGLLLQSWSHTRTTLLHVRHSNTSNALISLNGIQHPKQSRSSEPWAELVLLQFITHTSTQACSSRPASPQPAFSKICFIGKGYPTTDREHIRKVNLQNFIWCTIHNHFALSHYPSFKLHLHNLHTNSFLSTTWNLYTVFPALIWAIPPNALIWMKW